MLSSLSFLKKQFPSLQPAMQSRLDIHENILCGEDVDDDGIQVQKQRQLLLASLFLFILGKKAKKGAYSGRHK